MTVSGLHFMSLDFSITASIGRVPCQTTLWSSGTSLSCRTESLHRESSFKVTIATTAGTSHTVFSLDAPVLSYNALYNAPATTGRSVTLDGFSFSYTDLTPTLMLEAACATTSWTHATTVRCLLARSAANAVYTAALMTGLETGTVVNHFTFDAPVISFADTYNTPISSYSSVTVTGLNFWESDRSGSSVMGSSLCMTSSWIAATGVLCQPSIGVGNHQVSLLVNSVTGARHPL